MIKDVSRFRELERRIGTATFPRLKMPDQIFRSAYGNYRFLDFDYFASAEFWIMLQFLLGAGQDESVAVVSIDPSSEEYFYRRFGEFRAVEISAHSTAEEYLSGLKAAPQSSPAESLCNVAMILAWCPPSLNWLIWGERLTGLMVLAFAYEFNAPSSDEIMRRSSVCLLSIEDALDISAAGWADRKARLEFARNLLRNYGSGQGWEDPVTSRALELARLLIENQIGTIEACREFSAMSHQFSGDLTKIFNTFKHIDSETHAFPIGRVRAEWAPEALRQKDIEIASRERTYRPIAIEASRQLTAKLLELQSRDKDQP